MNFERENISIYIDRLVSLKWRLFWKKSFGLLALASFIVSLFGNEGIFDGLALLFFSLFIMSLAFESFYNSSRFAGQGGEYAVALARFGAIDTDITSGFLNSLPGRILLFRLGLSPEQVASFLKSDRSHLTDMEAQSQEKFITFGHYAAHVYEADKSLQSFLSSLSINSSEFSGAALWIGHELVLEMKEKQWWSKENLKSVTPIGISLDYGSPYELSKYGKPLQLPGSLVDTENNYRKKEITQLENILGRGEEANAIIIDDDESVSRDIVLRFMKKRRLGYKKIIELDTVALVSEKKSKQELESEILKLLRTTEYAGNIIIYVSNLPGFLVSCKNVGVSLASLLSDFLDSKNLQVIAHATEADFHYFIETSQSLLSKFERLIPDKEGVEASMPILLEKTRLLESKDKIFFTYPAVLALAEGAERFVTYGEMPGKALDLLVEIVPWAIKNEVVILLKNHVSTFLSLKTGIVSGEISAEEGEKLTKMEEILHERIVGQDQAVLSVASSMRRVRSGITNHKRPFASFLFLGPTGVGKTETSKALAMSFFGGEDKMVRFDMSEYSGAEALPTLIGSSSQSTSGLLSSTVRDNPYGVLLLDEFEKASPDVLNLFLQILDEGEFKDALGKNVNCRNFIIIATSNAGSEVVWKMVEEKLDLNTNKQKIIDFIIKERVLKPELINRFDSVVVFHPLQTAELEQVAKMMFERLAERIKKEKDIEIRMASSLLNQLVSMGSEPEFGARSINRIMQEKVEDFIAKQIISGSAKSGDILEIKAEDVV